MALSEQFGEALDELNGALGELDKASEAGDMDAVNALRPRLNAVYARLVHVRHVMDNGENPPTFGLPPERHGGSRIIHN